MFAISSVVYSSVSQHWHYSVYPVAIICGVVESQKKKGLFLTAYYGRVIGFLSLHSFILIASCAALQKHLFFLTRRRSQTRWRETVNLELS